MIWKDKFLYRGTITNIFQAIIKILYNGWGGKGRGLICQPADADVPTDNVWLVRHVNYLPERMVRVTC